jgi:hypothetical protein
MTIGRIRESMMRKVFAMTKLITAALVLLTLVGRLAAADRSPRQILQGKPAASSIGSNRYYDAQGSFGGRSSSSGNSTQF